MGRGKRISNKYEIDFLLFGLVCSGKEYKVSWHIDRVMEISLEKAVDSQISMSDGSSLKISNYLFENDFLFVVVIRNKLITSSGFSHQLLVPELSQFDYLIKIKDNTGTLSKSEVLEKLRSIPIVSYCTDINFDKLKSKENLLFETYLEDNEE